MAASGTVPTARAAALFVLVSSRFLFSPNKSHLLLLSFFPSSDDGGDDAVRTRRRRRGEAPLTAASAALFVLIISSFPLIHLTFFSFHSSRAPTSLQFLSLIPVVVQPHSPALVHRSSDASYFPACATKTTSSVKMVVPTARASTTTPAPPLWDEHASFVSGQPTTREGTRLRAVDGCGHGNDWPYFAQSWRYLYLLEAG